MTMGSVNNILTGRIAATTANVLMRSFMGGRGGISMPFFLARRRLRTGWKVSPIIKPRPMLNTEKKSIVHSVHRQPLSTETKEPITGL